MCRFFDVSRSKYSWGAVLLNAYLCQAKFLELAVEGFPVNLEAFRGFTFVPVMKLEGLGNIILLEMLNGFVEREIVLNDGPVSVSGSFHRQAP